MTLPKNNRLSLCIVATAISLYLLLTASALFDPDHQLKNLEPYPDGLVYALSARNWVQGRGLQLVTQQAQLEMWVPPLYSVYLAPFYLLSNLVHAFYVGNIVLGVATIAIVSATISKVHSSPTALIVGILAYLSHLAVFWLPSVAMSENIALFLFVVVLYSLFSEKSKLHFCTAVISSVGLLFVKFAVAPMALTLIVLLIIKYLDSKTLDKNKAHLLFLTGIVFALGYYLVQSQTRLFITIHESLSSSQFFGTQFVLPNIRKYLIALTTNQGRFLWLNLGITHLGFVVLYIYSTYKFWRNDRFFSLTLWTGLASMLPLTLVFYEVDSRFYIYLYPLIALAVSKLFSLEQSVSKSTVLGLVIILSFCNVVLQTTLLKELLASNLLHRSTAWQYKAVQHFNQHLVATDVLITALPPFLVDAYQTSNYQTLPLSNQQEFLQKNESVWGNIDENLLDEYQQRIDRGQRLYVSNSYVTHQQAVVQDFDKLKLFFNLEQVSTDCFDTCNLYQLKSKFQN